MVGVKGKYKGCNTCRARRVKCDNTRPLCKKCTDHGRTCEGYERETVFIIGTSDDKGRVASHPPRNLNPPPSSSSSSSSTKRARTTPTLDWEPGPSQNPPDKLPKLELVSIQPLTPAWNETGSLASLIGLQSVRFVGLHTSLEGVIQHDSSTKGTWEGETTIVLPHICRIDVQPSFGDEEYWLRARCFVHLPDSNIFHDPDSSENGICLFVYEQNSSAAFSNRPPWREPDALTNSIRSLGPAYYQLFPAHHFFTRIYRPNAIFASILSRQPCALSSPEWSTVPYEHHPKTPLDSLLDLTSLLPALLARADRITPLPASISRRLKAKDLLANCTSIERQLEAWCADIETTAALNRDNPLLYWIDTTSLSSRRSHGGGDRIPFADTFAFSSPMLGMAHIYYWSSLMVLYTCIGDLLTAVEGLYPDPQQQQQQQQQAAAFPPIDPNRYQTREIRKVAANVCRSLDWALQSEGVGHPDALAAPLWIVEKFYEGIHGRGDGELESLWCVGFRGRLEDVAREVEDSLAGEERTWVEVGEFG